MKTPIGVKTLVGVKISVGEVFKYIASSLAYFWRGLLLEGSA